MLCFFAGTEQRAQSSPVLVKGKEVAVGCRQLLLHREHEQCVMGDLPYLSFSWNLGFGLREPGQVLLGRWDSMKESDLEMQ